MNTKLLVESWRQVPSNHWYEVSNKGRVRSWHKGGRSKGRAEIPRILRAAYASNDYLMVVLWRDGEPVSRLVHSLVLEAWVGPRPIGQQTRHLDGNRENNHLSNLRYGTPAENAGDRREHGTHLIGSKNPQSKLTEAQVRTARKLRAEGAQVQVLARTYGVSSGAMSSALTGKTWSELPGALPTRGHTRKAVGA